MTKELTIREILEKDFTDWETYKLKKGRQGTNMIIDLAHQEILKKIPSVEEIEEILRQKLFKGSSYLLMEFGRVNQYDVATAIHNLLTGRMG